MKRELKAVEFTRRIPKCPKCAGEMRRVYCTGNYGDCGDYFSPLRGKEHFDLICKECAFEMYQKVKS